MAQDIFSLVKAVVRKLSGALTPLPAAAPQPRPQLSYPGRDYGMTRDNPEFRLSTLIIRRMICVISWGFAFPRAFIEGPAEKPATQP